MRRRGSVSSLCLLAAAAAVAAGCGSTFTAASLPEAELYSRLEAPPVADLSGAEIDLPRAFAGVAYSWVVPVEKTLKTGNVYDLNLAYDLGSALVVEVVLGFWNIEDRPEDVPGADSMFEMRPALLMLQLTGELGRRSGRKYLGLGGGWSMNSYDLGPSHKSHVESEENYPAYSVAADDAFLLQVAGGFEFYSSADADLNLALELRYVTGTVERVQRSDGTIIKGDEIDVDVGFLLLRANVTWHF